jgi:hypothetical protein
MQKVERWKTEMPTEQEMLPKDKYTVFDRKVKRYRKGIHSESASALAFTLAALLILARRGAQVDEGQPETQPPGFLDDDDGEDEDEETVYTTCRVTVGIGADMASLWNTGFLSLRLVTLLNHPALYAALMHLPVFAAS